MRVILFIGHHKVGSSALQRYLAKNAPALARQGILYPAVEAAGMQRLKSRLRAAFWGPLHVNITEAHNALAFRMMSDSTEKPIPDLHRDTPDTETMLANIRAQIAYHKPHTVILASEVMANFANVGAVQIARLLANFEEADITLTATLRRVDDYLVSWMGQRLRFGQTPLHLAEGFMYSGVHFNYRNMVRPWIENAKGATWHLHDYADVVAAGGSVPHFFKTHGLPLMAQGGATDYVNIGLHRGLIELARRGNFDLDPGLAHDFFERLLRLGQQLDLPPSHDVELYGDDCRRDLVERFTPVHDYLSDFVGRPFFSDFHDMLISAPIPEAQANATALAQIRANHLDAMPAPLRDWLTQLELSKAP